MKKIYSILIVFSFFSIFLINIDRVDAANSSLYLSPSSGNYTVGNTFSIELRVNTGGIAINTSDGTLVFDPNKLQVVNISKTGSIFNLWVQEPIFSNSLGTIEFGGGKPSPGYTGASGKIMEIIFRAKTFGGTNLNFAAGLVLADDGMGTNILTHMGAGSYKIMTRETIPTTPPDEGYVPPSTPGDASAAPVVISSTHPIANNWYSNNSPEFSWKLPADASGVSLLLHQKSTANPGPTSDGKIEFKNFENIEDGVWYFHIKFKNQNGWGDILHRKVLIDTNPPDSFIVRTDNEEASINPRPILYFQTSDSLSGIDYYEITIGSEISTTSRASTKNNPYKLLPQLPGNKLIDVAAFDKAGNYVSASIEIEILSINVPKLTKVPISVSISEPLVVEGTADPETIVRVYIQKENKDAIIEKLKVDSDGKFTLTYDKVLEKGDYLVWAQSEGGNGALSYTTKKYSLEVGLPPFLKVGKIALDYLTTMITLIILIVGSIAVIFYTWYRISIWRKRIRKETGEVSMTINSAFQSLREEVEEQVDDLSRKTKLTKKEKDVRDKLKDALNVSETLIEKEVKDIEKEVE